jgi:hypothetical protein
MCTRLAVVPDRREGFPGLGSASLSRNGGCLSVAAYRGAICLPLRCSSVRFCCCVASFLASAPLSLQPSARHLLLLLHACFLCYDPLHLPTPQHLPLHSLSWDYSITTASTASASTPLKRALPLLPDASAPRHTSRLTPHISSCRCSAGAPSPLHLKAASSAPPPGTLSTFNKHSSHFISIVA